jgi:hypothetical protein
MPFPKLKCRVVLWFVDWVDGRFRDKPEVFANQARQCAILSTSSAMLYDAPGQEDEDSGLRFVKTTKDEYKDVLRISDIMWKRKVDGQQSPPGT